MWNRRRAGPVWARPLPDAMRCEDGEPAHAPRVMMAESRAGGVASGHGRLMKALSWLAALWLSLAGGAGQAGISVSLQPATSWIEPGSTLRVYVQIDSARSEFNGYQAVIRWDPDVLGFVSIQPEELFSQYEQWWMPEAGADSVLISHAILEGGGVVTGPGSLCSIDLRGLRDGVSPVAFEYAEFYRFGFRVEPVLWYDASVLVGDLSAVGDVAGRDLVELAPHPVVRSSWIRLRAAGDGTWMVRLFDLAGRLVARGSLPPERNGLRTPLESVIGRRDLAAGGYLLVLESEGRRVVRRVVVVR